MWEVLKVIVGVAAIVLLVAAPATRGAFRGQRPILRTKPGESPAEAKVILLGSFRFYSWAMGAAVSAWVLQRIGEFDSVFLTLLGLGSFLAMLLLSNAMYWRLGYDRRRWLMALCHVSALFALFEYYVGLRRDLHYVAPETVAGK